MNTVALRFIGITLAIAVATLMFLWLLKVEQVQKLRNATNWLLKISYFDFVKLFIFIRPLKKYFIQTGILIWIALVFVLGRYLIVTQPRVNEIPGPYIPLIGYVYFLSILFIIHFVLRAARTCGLKSKPDSIEKEMGR